VASSELGGDQMGAGEIITLVSIVLSIILGLVGTIFYMLNTKINEINTRMETLERKTTESDKEQITSCETCRGNFHKEFKELSEKLNTTHLSVAKDIEMLNVSVASFGSVYATRTDIIDIIDKKR
jgi:Mg2+/Co2+ transporter CorB